MPLLEDIFTPSSSYSILAVGLAFVVGLIAGLFLKTGIIAKGKKRILHLEDEMLSNHSKILTLEKQVADLRKERENQAQKDDSNPKLGLRAS